MRSIPRIVDQLEQIYPYFQSAIVFIYEQASQLFRLIESHWFLIFTWYLLNTAFIIYIIGKSLFDWSDIITDGLVRGALLQRAKANRLEEAEERYQKRKAQNLEEAEERYQKRKAQNLIEAEERRLERQAELSRARLERENVLASRQVAVGDEYLHEGEDLAYAYFEEHPHALKVNIGGRTYTNYKYLNSLYEEHIGEDDAMNNLYKGYLAEKEHDQMILEQARAKIKASKDSVSDNDE